MQNCMSKTVGQELPSGGLPCKMGSVCLSGNYDKRAKTDSPKWSNIDAWKIYLDDKIPELERHINYHFAILFPFKISHSQVL